MQEKELRNLQVYIGKRAKGQSDEQVIAHINKINNKTPLTQEEWHKLIFPCCNNGYAGILKIILSYIDELKDVSRYIQHTVYGRCEAVTTGRIEVLKVLIPYIKENNTKILSEAMIDAAWFGETEIVKFLIESGANPTFQTENGIDLEKCIQRVEEVFKDNSLREYLKNK